MVYLIIFGVPLAVIGGLILRQQTRLRRKGVRVMGTVTRTQGSTDAGGTSYTPVVRFHTQAGEEIETETGVGTPWKGRQVGKVVPVIYDPARPTRAQIDTPGKRGVLTVSGLVMFPGGVALVVVGIVLLIQG
jgi:hypothetical protein